MTAPEGESDEPPTRPEAIVRIQGLPAEFDENGDDYTTIDASDRELQSVLYTGGSTEYAHIYVAAVTGTYNGNRMLWVRYVWLSKPGAYESDMWGDNGMTFRMVDGMENSLPETIAAACNGLSAGEDRDKVVYTEV